MLDYTLTSTDSHVTLELDGGDSPDAGAFAVDTVQEVVENPLLSRWELLTGDLRVAVPLSEGTLEERRDAELKLLAALHGAMA